jgi:hypothetical protein
MAGHLGIKRTLSLLTRKGHGWKGIRKDVKDYMDRCQICQRNKPRTGPGYGELHTFLVPGSPWEVMSWNMIGPLPESHAYNVIVTMVDVKTKAIKLELADITITARGVAVVMKNRVFREEGLPAKVISDRGPQFIRCFMKELYAMLWIEGNLSMAYHLQTDGQTERINREVKKYLWMFTNFQQDDWVDRLPLVEFTYNNVIHETTGQTLFFLNKGRHLQSLPDDPIGQGKTSAAEFLCGIEAVARSAEKSLLKAKMAMKERWQHNKKERVDFNMGELVLVTADHLPMAWPSKKLDQKWRGPFRVVKKVGEGAYELDLLGHWKGHRTFNEGN